MQTMPQSPLARPFFFASTAFVVALLCSAWAVFGGGPHHGLAWDRLPVSPANDAITHLETLAAAAEAQQKGSVMEAPRLARSVLEGYPVFQFYSFVPYHLPALGIRAGLGPFHALLLACYFTFVFGSWGIALWARARGNGPWASLFASAAFCWAPFHLTDLFGRIAFTELFAFALMPWLFWSGTATLRRESWGPWLAHSACWALLILTHHIFHLWALPLLFLWLTLDDRPGPRWSAFLRPLSAYTLGLAMGLFFFAPTVVFGPQTAMARFPMLHGLSPLPIVLDPGWAQTPFVRGSSPFLGLQIGWAFLWAALWSLRRAGAWREAPFLLFVLCVLLVVAPPALWDLLGPLKVIQFPYRLLLFATMFGALQVARWSTAWMGPKALLVGLVLLGLWGLAWKRTAPDLPAATVESAYQAEGVNFRVGLTYALSDEALDRFPDWTETPADHASDRLVVLPRLYYPGCYSVTLQGRRLITGRVGRFLAVFQPEGAGSAQVKWIGLPWATAISKLAFLAWILFALGAILPIKKAGLSPPILRT
jgi:hypothetical protein